MHPIIRQRQEAQSRIEQIDFVECSDGARTIHIQKDLIQQVAAHTGDVTEAANRIVQSVLPTILSMEEDDWDFGQREFPSKSPLFARWFVLVRSGVFYVADQAFFSLIM